MSRPSFAELVLYTRESPMCSPNRGHVLLPRLKSTVLIAAPSRSPPLRRRPTACPQECLLALPLPPRLQRDVLLGLLRPPLAQCGNRAPLLESRCALKTQCCHPGVVAPSLRFDTGVNWPPWKTDPQRIFPP